MKKIKEKKEIELNREGGEEAALPQLGWGDLIHSTTFS